MNARRQLSFASGNLSPWEGAGDLRAAASRLFPRSHGDGLSLDTVSTVATIFVPAIPFNYDALGVNRDKYLLDEAIDKAKRN